MCIQGNVTARTADYSINDKKDNLVQHTDFLEFKDILKIKLKLSIFTSICIFYLISLASELKMVTFETQELDGLKKHPKAQREKDGDGNHKEKKIIDLKDGSIRLQYTNTKFQKDKKKGVKK